MSFSSTKSQKVNEDEINLEDQIELNEQFKKTVKEIKKLIDDRDFDPRYIIKKYSMYAG